MERDKILKKFGERVKAARVEKNLSQEDLADICQLDRTYISGIERGLRNPSLTGILKVAYGLRVDPGVLVQDLLSQDNQNIAGHKNLK